MRSIHGGPLAQQQGPAVAPAEWDAIFHGQVGSQARACIPVPKYLSVKADSPTRRSFVVQHVCGSRKSGPVGFL